MPRNFHPRLIVTRGGRLEVTAECPVCGNRTYGKSRFWGDLPLTEDGRVDLTAYEFTCRRCYPETMETTTRRESHGAYDRVSGTTRYIPHPDTKPFRIGA